MHNCTVENSCSVVTVNIVTGLLRARIVEPEGTAIARQRSVNKNKDAMFSVGSAQAMLSCNKRRLILKLKFRGPCLKPLLLTILTR
jgi:hypothetical protein